MKANRAGGVLAAGILVVVALAFRAAAGEETAGVTNAGMAGPKSVELGRAAHTPGAHGQGRMPLTAGELLTLAEARVSPAVMKSFVETSPLVTPPSAKDLIALKEHGVPDEVTLALLKRSAESQTRTTPKAVVIRRFTGPARPWAGGLDPESYEYFQHYYLYPRTLSWVYDQLGYYRSPYWP